MPYLDEIHGIWLSVKELFKKSMSTTVINLWFDDLVIKSYDNSTVTFSTDSEFKFNIIREKYLEAMEIGFSEMLGFDVNVAIIFDGVPVDVEKIKKQIVMESPKIEVIPQQAEAKTSLGSTLPPYNFEYTFENFIVGNSNKFAHAACTAVAANPAKDYNPLFIYGPSGLGKTHLLYAITNELSKIKKDIKIIYIKGDDFTNQLIESLSRQGMKDFRDKYRNCDVLLIDDIQFIAGKNSTQEEFFHTFNTLYEERKQIILTSDRPPHEIKTLEDRLKSRFEWGLIADIQPPDLELRIAIIKKKAETVNVEIPNDVLIFLAENLRSNIRQIEGAIKKLGALSFLSGRKISMELAKGCLSELLGGAEPTSVTVDKIFTAVSKKYNITKDDIVSAKRTKDIAQTRHISIYLIRKITDMSLPNIGKIFNRDHSTIISSIETVEKKLQTDSMFEFDLSAIENEVQKI